jgi:hypothetical protein
MPFAPEVAESLAKPISRGVRRSFARPFAQKIGIIGEKLGNSLVAARFAKARYLDMDRAMTMRTQFDRAVAVAIAGLAVLMAAPSAHGQPQGETAITCTNPVSGTSWQIAIDYRNGTVDSYPAAISRGEISWFDPKDGGSYTLDRASGDLTGSVASSTGGYFRHSRCSLEKAR